MTRRRQRRMLLAVVLGGVLRAMARLDLVAQKKTRILKRLFESATRWTLKSTARAEILKPDIGDDVRANFAACEVTKPSTPKLEVREKK